MNGEELFELREQISDEVHKLVDKMTAKLNKANDDELRQQLTEEFRFWRQ